MKSVKPGLFAVVASTLSLWALTAWVSVTAAPLEGRIAPCLHCHGDDGRATAEGYYPRIAGKPVDYLYAQLLHFRDGRRRHPAMTGIVRGLSDAYLYEMATWFAGVHPPFAPIPPSAGNRSALEAGRRLALEGSADGRVPACTACHGKALMGLEPAMPGLLGLSRDYLNAQLGAWVNRTRRASGPDCMAEIVSRMKPDEIASVSQWLSVQTPPPTTVRPSMAGMTFPLKCGTHTAPSRVEALRPPTPLRPDASEAARRGAYLAVLGNCAGCHTLAGDVPFAGARAIETPYGRVYAGNLTPDVKTGLGAWSSDAFYRALTKGISRDGHRLYPAFPWPYYARFSRAQSDDLFAFLQQLDPVSRSTPEPQMRFPFNQRSLLSVWSLLYGAPSIDTGLRASAAGDDRGEWLANGPGHCGACHTPKRFLGGDDPSRRLAGAVMPGDAWHAPALGRQEGRADDDVTRLVRYLGTGVSDARAAAGPMAHVVADSLQFWRADDLSALSRYLLARPQADAAVSVSRRSAVSQAESERILLSGERLYERHCSECHGRDGGGVPGRYPALAGVRAVQLDSPLNAVRVTVHGGYPPSTAGNPRPHGMPPFRVTLGAQDIADVLTYVRQSWGGQGTAVTVGDVERLRGSADAQP